MHLSGSHVHLLFRESLVPVRLPLGGDLDNDLVCVILGRVHQCFTVFPVVVHQSVVEFALANLINCIVGLLFFVDLVDYTDNDTLCLIAEVPNVVEEKLGNFLVVFKFLG